MFFLKKTRVNVKKKRSYHFLHYLKYLGNKVYCPCCQHNSRKFLSFGRPPRPSAQCPKCGALERHRLLQLYLEGKTDFLKDKLKVLHVGPTSILQEKWSALPNIDYVSVDIKSPLAMMKMDITDIPLPDDQFDCIICIYVLQMVQDDKKAIQELFRVLKPGGWAILQSLVDFNRNATLENPNLKSAEERKRFLGKKKIFRIYGKDYQDRLEKAGFAVKIDPFVENLKNTVIEKCGLNKKEKIYFCTKPKQ